MTDFDDALTGLTDAVFDTFGRPGPAGQIGPLLYPIDGSAAFAVRAILDRGSVEETLNGAIVARPQASVRIPFVDAPRLRAGDELEAEGLRWKLAGAPVRPGLGTEWQAPIDQVQARA